MSNYYCLKDILRDFGVTFDDIYAKFNVTVTMRIFDLFKTLSLREFMILVVEEIKFLFGGDNEYLKKITIQEFLTHHNFSKESVEYISILSGKIDGATITNFTMWEFLQMPNQYLFYSEYEPRVPNDVGLFKIWFDAMMKTGQIDIMLNTEIKSIHVNYIKTQNDSIITAHMYIFTIPPKPMLKILSQCPNPNLFGPINEVIKWGTRSQFITVLTTTFHWDTKYNILNKEDNPDSAYRIAYLDYSSTTYFADPRSKTVVVCSATVLDRISPNNGKTANQCSPEELLKEIFAQFKSFQPHLPEPTVAILSPDIYRTDDNKYETHDSAFVLTPMGHKSFNSESCSNLFWVGSHNGNSLNALTSMESAMENAIVFLHWLLPETKNKVLIHNIFTVRDFIVWFIIFLIILFIYIYKIRN